MYCFSRPSLNFLQHMNHQLPKCRHCSCGTTAPDLSAQTWKGQSWKITIESRFITLELEFDIVSRFEILKTERTWNFCDAVAQNAYTKNKFSNEKVQGGRLKMAIQQKPLAWCWLEWCYGNSSWIFCNFKLVTCLRRINSTIMLLNLENDVVVIL